MDPPIDSNSTSPIGTSYSTTVNAHQTASMTNGYASVTVASKKITFYYTDPTTGAQKLVLTEYWPKTGFPARWYSKINWKTGFRSQFAFSASNQATESIFGTGQDHTGYINKKNLTLDLVKFNAINPIPSYMSDQGYVFFWNVPSLGRMEFSPDK
jgi:hypothetical protein